ncbi:hypothetical protein X801_04602 [Opisthorchis viverrini]|uniref:Uncharacterized protein n=1 Tax=Opisthorchis viverrini TaxID=6198 RepID=A0A1S8WZ81_OPIVI|nr:hypothetical protein X801_04602 [Opisthorchis viverrini]
MPQSDDGLRPPRNASATEHDAVHSSDNRHIELRLARLRIRELESQLELQKVSEPELRRFNGNANEYWAFMKTFSSTIGDRTRNDEARLGCLVQSGDSPSVYRRSDHWAPQCPPSLSWHNS